MWGTALGQGVRRLDGGAVVTPESPPGAGGGRGRVVGGGIGRLGMGQESAREKALGLGSNHCAVKRRHLGTETT